MFPASTPWPSVWCSRWGDPVDVTRTDCPSSRSADGLPQVRSCQSTSAHKIPRPENILFSYSLICPRPDLNASPTPAAFVSDARKVCQNVFIFSVVRLDLIPGFKPFPFGWSSDILLLTSTVVDTFPSAFHKDEHFILYSTLITI